MINRTKKRKMVINKIIMILKMMMMMKMKMMIKMIMIKTMAKYLNKMTNIKSFNKLSIKIKSQANPLKY